MLRNILIKLTVPALSVLMLSACCGEGYNYVRITPSCDADSLELKAIDVFGKVASKRTPKWNRFGKRLDVRLVRDTAMAPESFDISLLGETYQIAASESHGLMYGLGHLLHTSTFDNGRMLPGGCTGYSAPDKSVRGMYFATHFHNFYHSAPINEVEDYVGELALWGYNSLMVWFDKHHYTGVDDPEAAAMVERLAQLLNAGRKVGMSSGMIMMANEGFSTTPDELRTSRIDWTGYYDCQICPSKPGGTELILKNHRDMMDRFISAGIHLDRVCLWPYDQGGCSCKDCSPWGANAYLKLTKKVSALIKEKFPDAEIVLSTWLFDFEEEDKGEWKGLAKAFAEEKPWADYLMADSHTAFPRYLLENDVPGNLPLLNFPEISMYRNRPWGGYGSNAMPEHYSEIYHEVSDMLEGGFPYSEGKFEDINKVLYARMYWSDSLKGPEIFREYVSYEFSSEYAESICKAVSIMEKNQDYNARNFDRDTTLPRKIIMPGTDFGAKEAYDIFRDVDSKLNETVRMSWRWRMLYLRAELDWLLRESDGAISEEINRDFGELVEISHLQTANFCLRPPYKENM